MILNTKNLFIFTPFLKIVFSKKIFLFYITKITFEENSASSSVSTKFNSISTKRNNKNIFPLPLPLLPNFLQFWHAFVINAKYKTKHSSMHNWHGSTISTASKSPDSPKLAHSTHMLNPSRYPLNPIINTASGNVQTVREKTNVTLKITVMENPREKKAPNPL